MPKSKTSDARERVLDVAERLFHERGYKAVTMRDIADRLDIRQASLYYHAPGGKEELYAMVLERSMERHRQGLEAALQEAEPDLSDQLRAAATWLLSQPPIHLSRILTSDLPTLSNEDEQERLRELCYNSTMLPIVEITKAAKRKKEIQSNLHPDILAHSFLTIVDGLWYHAEVQGIGGTKERMANGMIKVLLEGLRPR
jgi:AcrR family transcriptional regulator